MVELAVTGLTLVAGLVLLRAVAVFLWVVCTGDTSGRDEAGAKGRWNLLREHRPDRHLVTPAIGRKGWAKR